MLFSGFSFCLSRVHHIDSIHYCAKAISCVRTRMTDLNSSLQNYLSKGDQNSGSGSSKFNLGKLNFFQKKSQTSIDVPESNDVANSWFSQANTDPCLPSLVRYYGRTLFIFILIFKLN